MESISGKIRTWREGVLQCRMYGHDWQPSRAVYNPKLRFYYVERVCLRCIDESDGRPTTKHEEISDTGVLLASWITYTPNYLLSPGTGRITGTARDELRVETIVRVLKPSNDSRAEPQSLSARDYLV